MPVTRRPRSKGVPRSKASSGAATTSFGAITSRARRAPAVPLANVRLRDLMSDNAGREPSRLITVRVPQHVLKDVRAMADRFGSTYADTVVALLNEGLDAARKRKLL